MRDVAVIGVGMTPFGELWDRSLRDLFVAAALDAMDDAGVDHIDSMVVGAMSSGLFVGQEHLSSVLSDYLGVTPVPAVRVESACASGAMALRAAYAEVAAGISDIVLAAGVEKMTDVDGSDATHALSTAADMEYESFHGVTFPGLYALIARSHMERYGTTREQLAQVAVKNHANGAKNPKAQFRRPIDLNTALSSVLVADPLRVMDCSPISDGAAAAIVCPLEMAKEIAPKPAVRIAAIAAATDTIALHQREDITWFGAVAEASQAALRAADRDLDDVDLAEVHDCFTIAELCVMEAIGLVEKGQSGPAVAAGMTALDGKLPINASGGLKSKGHPVGATGVAQIFELVTQLRGDAGERQVKDAKIGLAQNMGGAAGSCVVSVLEAI